MRQNKQYKKHVERVLDRLPVFRQTLQTRREFNDLFMITNNANPQHLEQLNNKLDTLLISFDFVIENKGDLYAL